jgi:uncharacterized protein YggU (UPF0235/DUF167 family)
MLKLKLKVIPSSARDELVTWLGDSLKVKVRAAPEKGKANKAVESLLCKQLALPRRAVTITAGLTSSKKTAQIEGLDSNQLEQRLAAAGIKSPGLQ